jgi:hypothetical protein
VFVTGGEELAIGLFGPGTSFGADGNNINDIYTGGRLYAKSEVSPNWIYAGAGNNDLFFQTFVDPNAIAPVPLPPSIVSQLIGFGLLVWLAKRKKRKGGSPSINLTTTK